MSILSSTKLGAQSLVYARGIIQKITNTASVLYCDYQNNCKYIVGKPHKVSIEYIILYTKNEHNYRINRTFNYSIPADEVQQMYNQSISEQDFTHRYKERFLCEFKEHYSPDRTFILSQGGKLEQIILERSPYLIFKENQESDLRYYI